ncbi:MAG: hypothetical protein JO117_06135 [Verrucomicrobia bacterium]|nr:hypothetical protein [Verrucomicrobiota bacterium]MBV9658953.1 hypothetical protein [Verrucomicrobiota bacterium]
MSDLFEFLFDLLCSLGSWRFSVCLLAGIVLFGLTLHWIPIGALRWIVGGGLLLSSMVAGACWESGK